MHYDDHVIVVLPQLCTLLGIAGLSSSFFLISHFKQAYPSLKKNTNSRQRCSLCLRLTCSPPTLHNLMLHDSLFCCVAVLLFPLNGRCGKKLTGMLWACRQSLGTTGSIAVGPDGLTTQSLLLESTNCYAAQHRETTDVVFKHSLHLVALLEQLYIFKRQHFCLQKQS